jgi:hypothetical protein
LLLLLALVERRPLDARTPVSACDTAPATLVQSGLAPLEDDPEAREACAAASAETGIPCAPFVVVTTLQRPSCLEATHADGALPAS